MNYKHTSTLGCVLSAIWLAACAGPAQPEIISPPTMIAPATPADESPTLLPQTADSSQTADLVIAVNLTDVQGTINPLAGLQGGPLPIVRGDGDLTSLYQAGAVDHVRLPQNTLPNNLTLGGIFPNMFAPADDPRSYQFQRIDRYIQAVVDAGATPLWQATFDIGSGDTLTEGDRGLQQGPLMRRPDQWSAAVQHTLMHFNDGWADGHEWQVRFVEFLDNPFELGGCIDVDTCWRLFRIFAEAINDYNAQTSRDVQIVGPSMPISASPEALEVQLEQLSLLLQQLEPDELDYLSFHPTGRSTLENNAIAQELRRLLDTSYNGRFANVGLWASQWHAPAEGTDDAALARVAAAETATKILWQDTVDFSTLYRADRWPQGPAEAADPLTGEVNCAEVPVCEESLYFTPDGRPRAPFLPFFALAEMARDTPERVAVVNEAQHQTPVLAARAPDAALLAVLLAAPGAASQTYIVTLAGLPPGVSFLAERFTVDSAAHPWEPVESSTMQTNNNGTLTLNGQFFGPSVVYWRLNAQ